MATKNIIVIGGTGLGKSALCNVLTGTNKFKEGALPISETQNIQLNFFHWKGIEYFVVDTIGIWNTNQPNEEVLKSMRFMLGNVWHVLLVFDGKFSRREIELYDLLKNMFKESLITIVRTKCHYFQNKEIFRYKSISLF